MKQLKGKELKDKSLEEWFKKRQQSDFRDLKTDYVARYNALEGFLKSDVHPIVALGPAIRDGIFLNDHGPAHVATVINRASSLISTDTCRLSAYEAYILLAAIQLHDIGNILGRKGHEARINELEGRVDALLGDDSAERRIVKEIAQAHGGAHNGDADTIQHLVDGPVLNQNVRTRFLAGLLRFADELADDSQRISAFAIQNDAIPESSKLFHKYSASLQSVMVDAEGKSIRLHYEMNRADADEEFTKGDSKHYLIDEILSRTVKMHRERTYCARFLQPMILIDSINVKIDVFKSKGSPDKLFSIGYRLEDTGYPSAPKGGIYELCPELRDWRDGKPLNGTTLLSKIAGTQQ